MWEETAFSSFIDELFILYDNRDNLIDIIVKNLTFVDLFPINQRTNLYYDSYYFKLEDIILINPRNYWQDKFSHKSLMNFNSWWVWAEPYPESVYNRNFEKWFVNINENSYFHTKFIFIQKSLYESNLFPTSTMLHHDYANHYVLTHNMFVGILSSNYTNYLTGFYLCYYEPFAAIEIFLQPYFGICIDLLFPAFSFYFKGHYSFYIDIVSDTFKHYEDINYFRNLKRVNFDQMAKYPLEKYLILHPLPRK